ncbi:hypothetical protein acdb102_14150 [Acidothermaceae bacterium B102]|nr:hypothetical protein acdb102_14150 [Acidothermaceae bacterium B102]
MTALPESEKSPVSETEAPITSGLPVGAFTADVAAVDAPAPELVAAAEAAPADVAAAEVAPPEAVDELDEPDEHAVSPSAATARQAAVRVRNCKRLLPVMTRSSKAKTSGGCPDPTTQRWMGLV